MVIPEGRDDLELRGPDHRVLCQVKSRRDHLGAFGAKAVAEFIKKMWSSKARRPSDRFLLVLESGVDERNTPQASLKSLEHYAGVLGHLKGQKNLAAESALTQVLVLPNPRADALAKLTGLVGCTLQEADVYFADLLGFVGDAADANGMREPSNYAGLGVSDVQSRFESLQAVLTSAVVEEALTTGICAAVDFLTPDNDPLFYVGVDTQPTHVAAGLVVERPDLRAAVVDGLHDRRNALIHGPSGSGKSAILWDAAYATRHAVRWFQIRRLPLDAVGSLKKLAQSRRASMDAPVGFIIDDVGKGLSDAWSALAEEVRRSPGVLLLASVREEDKNPLEQRHQARQIRVDSDEALAERMWAELRQRGQTNWHGWKEPWNMSNGHLLEYAHVLTQGQRLSETLANQVAKRLNDARRHDELDVLRVVACANAAGCSAEVMRLPDVLRKPASIVSLALSRLRDEHLVIGTGDGRLVGLHDLRSSELLRLTHEFPPPLLATTASAAVRVVPSDELWRFLERTLSEHPDCDEPVLRAVVQRIGSEPTASLFSEAVRGLDLVDAHRVVTEWLTTSQTQALPSAYKEHAATLGLADQDWPDIEQFQPFFAASTRFAELRRKAASSSLVRSFVAHAGVEGFRRVLGSAAGLRDLTLVLDSLCGQQISEEASAELLKLQPSLQDEDFNEVVSLLRIARVVSPGVACEWVRQVGQENLLQRFVDNVSWASVPTLIESEGVREIRANVWCVVPAVTNDINEAVVRVCEILLALAPSATLIASDALGADGEPFMMTPEYPMVQKRMHPDGLPPPALVSRNRGWIRAIKNLLNTDSKTAYLSGFVAQLQILNRSLKLALDSAFRNSWDQAALKKLDEVQEHARELARPKDLQSEVSLPSQGSKLQSLLFDCSAALVTRLSKLPDGAAAYIAWIHDLLAAVKSVQVDEPWEILAAGPPKELAELARILEGFRAMAGEALIRKQSPLVTHRKPGAKKGAAFDAACQSARRYHDLQFEELQASLRAQFCPKGSGRDLFLLPDGAAQYLWPPADVLLTISIDNSEDAQTIWYRLRAAVDESRRVCLLPVIGSFGLTAVAIGGLSAPGGVEDADAWCAVAGVRPLPLHSVSALKLATEALTQLDGMRSYLQSKTAHTLTEQQTYEELTNRFREAKESFVRLAMPAEVINAFNHYVDAVLSQDLSLAAEASQVLARKTGPALENLGQLIVAVTTVDLARAGAADVQV